MSMNLYAMCGDETIELWQTPTHISAMCCMNQYGDVVEMRGRNAKRALYAYLAWIASKSNGSYPSQEAALEAHQLISEHTDYIESWLKKDVKHLRVFVA